MKKLLNCLFISIFISLFNHIALGQELDSPLDNLDSKNKKDSIISYSRNYVALSLSTNRPVGVFADTLRSRIQVDEPGYARPGGALFAEAAFYPFSKVRFARFIGWKASFGIYFNPFDGNKFASNVVSADVSPWVGSRLFTGPELSIPLRWRISLDMSLLGGFEALRSPRREGSFGPLGIAEIEAQTRIAMGYSYGWGLRYDFDKVYFGGALYGKAIRVGREWSYARFNYTSPTIGSYDQEVKQRRWYFAFIWYLPNKSK
ncbi:MAG: hypothetical protein JJT94_00555 [Bernardetiaceae bacterium]|nr:hypothetical protein [Bernardetiaceae bacterium]